MSNIKLWKLGGRALVLVESLSFPIDYVAQSVSHVSADLGVAWPSPFRCPFGRRLDRQPVTVREFLGVCHLSSSISSMAHTSLRSPARVDDITVSLRQDTAVQYFLRKSIEVGKPFEVAMRQASRALTDLQPISGAACGYGTSSCMRPTRTSDAFSASGL
jgi:hypothetical protein